MTAPAPVAESATVPVTEPVVASVAEDGGARHPRRLLRALLGEQVRIGVDEPMRAGVYLDVMRGAGVAPPTARAGLDRMVLRGFLTRARVGREVQYGLTDSAREVLREASERIHSPQPFAPRGPGWTLITFSVPEEQRALRQRLRAALSWAGFAPIRDGLWVAPGEVDLDRALRPVRADLPEHCLVAFRAHDLPDHPLVPSARGAWDLDELRGQHERFLAVWSGGRDAAGVAAPLSTLTLLVADWIALLRADPRLPEALLEPDWPAARSYETYRACRAELAEPAEAELRRLLAR